MNVQKEIAQELNARSKECDRKVIAVAEHPLLPDAGIGIALLAPDCIVMSYCAGKQSPVFDICLN